MYDYYKILEIPRNANLEEIKRAYRNKAKLVHPDVNSSAKATEVFAVVSEAYETLTDDNKRYLHDVKLNFVDTTKAEAERKKQYYGNSVKNDTYTNANFQADWNIAKNAYKEKTDEDYYKANPVLYTMFFVSGMTIGFIIIFIFCTGTMNHYWPAPFGLIGITGVILVIEGWKGLTGRKTILVKIVKRLKSK